MENNTLCNRHSLGVNNHTKMYVTYTRIYGWSDYGGESSYQPGYRLENMMWMTLLVYDYIIPGEKFLGSTSQAMVCIAVVLIWINLGYNIILFLSAIKDIPYSYYEAAKLDGANSWQTFWKITFPLLKPTSVFVLITSVIASFQCLDLIMVMTGGGPAKSTEVASLYIYKQSFEMMKAGYGAGLSVVMFLILTVLAVIMLKINGKEE